MQATLLESAHPHVYTTAPPNDKNEQTWTLIFTSSLKDYFTSTTPDATWIILPISLLHFRTLIVVINYVVFGEKHLNTA